MWVSNGHSEHTKYIRLMNVFGMWVSNGHSEHLIFLRLINVSGIWVSNGHSEQLSDIRLINVYGMNEEEINSKINPIYNGQFKVDGIKHSGTISGAVGGECKTSLDLFLGTEILQNLKIL